MLIENLAEKSKKWKRIFVCDPVCMQAFGHNVAQLNYFVASCAPWAETITPLCCKLLDDDAASENGFEQFYNYYYQEFMKNAKYDGSERGEDRSHYGYSDDLEYLATEDALRFLDRYSIDENDAILFPSLDFYGVAGLINALQQRPQCRPQIFLRFIGVMENASRAYQEPMAELTARIVSGLRSGLRLSFSAETPRLADRLAVELNTLVSLVPFPQVIDAVPMPQLGPFVFFCAGSARFDKGYLHLLAIFSEIRMRDPEHSIRFVTQVIPPSQSEGHERYTSQLYALPGVRMLPSILSAADLRAEYAACHAVLLPYDMGTYALRGSAVMMEAAMVGRPVIALEGPAFADQIRYYNLGQVVPTVEAMIDAAEALARESRESLEAKAAQARHRYVTDVVAGLETWLRGAA